MKNLFLHKSSLRVLAIWKRSLFHQTSWPKEYTFEVAKNIEEYWRPRLEESHKAYENNDEIKKKLPKKYILSMFPYPSGRLHLGHVRIYTLSDMLARYHRMNGSYVIHPIGWDAFGLPAENAAIERNIRPDIWTESNIDYMSKQFRELSISFDWKRELSTCDPSYYKWTQYIFLEMFRKGLVVQKEALVNWDPVDKTVLANEQIDDSGKSWRSGALVEKKILKQWFIKSSAYAKSLLNAMSGLNTNDWEIVKNIQRMWIGQIDGCQIDFQLKYEDESIADSTLSVFSKTPYAIHGISHIHLANHHPLLKNFDMSEKSAANTPRQLPCYAISPFSDVKIPIYLNTNNGYFGTLNANGVPYVDAKLAVPSLNEVDREFALAHELTFSEIFSEQVSSNSDAVDGVDDSDNRTLVNSHQLNGMSKREAFDAVTKQLIALGKGGHESSERLNDWCISRQRFWGTPIPLVYCSNCQVVPVPAEELPVRLPNMNECVNKEGQYNLKNSEWSKTTCPKCQGPAVRETDTMDTFMDSAWYFLRFLDVTNESRPFDRQVAHQQMPVDIYIGGVEHAMTHLFVSRLVGHFMHEQGELASQEPFKRFIAIGMVKGETFKAKRDGRYVSADRVEQRNNTNNNNAWFERDTDVELSKEFEKMSKSKMNGVDPQFMIQRYGVDFTRFFLLSFVHPKSERNFSLSSDMVDGTMNTLTKLWSLVGASVAQRGSMTMNEPNEATAKSDAELYKVRNTQLSMVLHNLNENFNMPSYLVAISKIIKSLRSVKPPANYTPKYYELLIEVLVLFAPVIPHFCNECWSKLKTSVDAHLLPTKFDKSKQITELEWPRLDADWTHRMQVKLNGSHIGTLRLKVDELNELTSERALALASQHESIRTALGTKPLSEYAQALELRPFLEAALSLKDPSTSKPRGTPKRPSKQPDDETKC